MKNPTLSISSAVITALLNRRSSQEGGQEEEQAVSHIFYHVPSPVCLPPCDSEHMGSKQTNMAFIKLAPR